MHASDRTLRTNVKLLQEYKKCQNRIATERPQETLTYPPRQVQVSHTLQGRYKSNASADADTLIRYPLHDNDEEQENALGTHSSTAHRRRGPVTYSYEVF